MQQRTYTDLLAYLDRKLSLVPEEPNAYERGLYDSLLNVKNEIERLLQAPQEQVVSAESVESWYNNWMKEKRHAGKEVATINILDMLKDYANHSGANSEPIAPDMTAKEFFNGLFDMSFMTLEEQETIFKGAELFAEGKART